MSISRRPSACAAILWTSASSPGSSHCADLDQPNWIHKTCGGKSGVKYWRTRMELIPEMYIVDMEPTSYLRAPIGKKRIWFDKLAFEKERVSYFSYKVQ
jgi:hypothetical protein